MPRDYRAEYERRVARGRERGLRPSDAAGQSRRSAESRRVAPRESVQHIGRARVEIVQTADRRYMQRRLRQAARENKNVVVYAVWKTDSDSGYGTQVFGGRDRSHQATRTGDRAEGKFRMLIASKDTLVRNFGTTGVPAATVVSGAAQLRADDNDPSRDPWDYLDDYFADWWDDDEGDY